MAGEDTQGTAGNQGGQAGGGQAGQGSQGADGSQGGQQGGGQGTILGGGQQGQQAGQTGAVSTGGDLGWRANIPEEFRNVKSLEAIKGKDINEALPMLLKNYVNAQSFIGRSVALPKEGDSPQKVQEFKEKLLGYLGRPAKAEEYTYEVPEVNGELLNGEIVNDFVSKAHQKGFTNDQLQFVLDEYAKIQNQGLETFRSNQKTALEQLKEEWGPRFTRKAVLAQRIVREIGGKEVLDLLDRTGLGNSPILVKFFSDLGEWAAEDGFIRADVAGVEGPEDARRKIAEIQGDPKHPYNDPKMSGTQAHKDAVAQMQRLHELAYS